MPKHDQDTTLSTYHSDFATEPIGGGNPYYRCVHCKISVPEINGRIEAHDEACFYRKCQENNLPYPGRF